MAEKAEKKPDAAAAPAHGDKKGGGGLLSKTPVLVGGAMIIEAVVLLAGIMIFRGGAPKAASGAEVAGTKNAEGGEGGAKAEGDTDKKRPVEIAVVDFRALNRKSGQTFLYDVSIVATSKAESKRLSKRKSPTAGT